MPKSMKPMWLTSVKDTRRLMSFCATAPRIPTSIVARARPISQPSSSPPGNSSVWVRMIA